MPTLSLPSDYPHFLAELKGHIRETQVRAALAVNSELVQLYWRIGRSILQQEQQQGWGAEVVVRLAQDLRQDCPSLTGFSPRNMRYMKAFAEAWPDESILQQLVAKITAATYCGASPETRGPVETASALAAATLARGTGPTVPPPLAHLAGYPVARPALPQSRSRRDG